MKSRSLLTQVLTVNILLIAVTVLFTMVAVNARLDTLVRGREAIVVGLAVAAALLGNWFVLRRRFKPLDELISAMERTDLASPHQPTPGFRSDSAEVRRLEIAFERMIQRLEAQRRAAGRAAVQAQERERRRIAQDLHDEVNQALTAVSLRLQASIERAPADLRRELAETKRLASQAMEELLALARQLRPAVLDDHGLLPALHSQVRDFSEQTGISANFNTRGPIPNLSPEQQLVIYRVTQEGLSNVAQHADDPAFTFTAAGTEKIGDVDAAILDIGGAIPWVRWYIDPRTGYILREKYKAMGQSGPFDGETNLADWRTADGLTMPYKHQNKQDGKETSNAEFKKIELNPAVDPKLFAKPAEAPADKQ